ncbi:MAG: AsnC family transcriptional regulator [Candidatus Bathyarchaeota archaeon]|nr:AsnC family transcriptional regulator [Candidatus Bathyarchaeota archaeon]
MDRTKKNDETDCRILEALLIESRMSFTDLSKLCNVSVTAVIRRYERLKKTGVICAETMHLCPPSIGYDCVAEIGIITDLADRAKTLELLKNKPLKTSGDESLGKYSIYGQLATRTLEELNETLQKIDLKPHIKSLDVLIYTDLWNNPWHPENLVVNSAQQEKTVTPRQKKQTPNEVIALSETDKQIAKILMKNSRTTFKEIAEKTSTSINNVIQRYQCLREKNVLNLSTISIDLHKLGYKVIADSYIKVENRGTLPKVEAQLLQIPNAVFCGKFVGGAYDLRIAVIIKDFKDFFRVKNKIQSIKNIKTAEFYLHDIPSPWPTDFLAKTLL